MNCFFLSLLVAECAAFHCDKHVVKMILELAQMLYTAHAVNNRDSNWRKKAPPDSYRMTHVRHPTAVWARSSPANYRFMVQLAQALCAEYTHRYGRTHKTEDHIKWLLVNEPDFPPPPDHDKPPAGSKSKSNPKPTFFSKGPCLKGMTPIPLTMPDDCYRGDAILAYREYYIRHKQHFARWTKRDVPKWFTVGVADFASSASGQTGEDKADLQIVLGMKSRKRKASKDSEPATKRKATTAQKVKSEKGADSVDGKDTKHSSGQKGYKRKKKVLAGADSARKHSRSRKQVTKQSKDRLLSDVAKPVSKGRLSAATFSKDTRPVRRSLRLQSMTVGYLKMKSG